MPFPYFSARSRFFSLAGLFLLFACASCALTQEGGVAGPPGLEALKNAAQQGDAKAPFNLGVCYANGWGVPQDLVQAYLLLSLAADHGGGLLAGSSRPAEKNHPRLDARPNRQSPEARARAKALHHPVVAGLFLAIRGRVA